MQHTVYIKTDSSNRITEINSSAFISDFSGWIEVDKGDEDRYHHAQGNYLPTMLKDENDVYRYKYENGKISERSADELSTDISDNIPVIPTDHERLETLETIFSEIGSLSLISGIKLTQFYKLQIKIGKINIEDVPFRWREQVRKELEENR